MQDDGSICALGKVVDEEGERDEEVSCLGINKLRSEKFRAH